MANASKDKGTLETPWVSVCIATYQRQEFLGKTLSSLKSQTLTNFEIIVSDNDPEESSRYVVEAANDDRIRYFFNEQNLGMAKNFNRAIAKAQGEFIVLLSDDDPVYPEMLEKLKNLSENVPGYGAYFGACNVRMTDPDVAASYGSFVGDNIMLASELPENEVRTYSGEQFLDAYFTYSIFPYLFFSCGVVRREIALGVGGFPEYGTAYFTDFGYIITTCVHSGCVVLNTVIGTQIVHKGNFGRDQFQELVNGSQIFYEYVSNRLSHLKTWPVLRPKFEKFLGGWVISHAVFLRKLFKAQNLNLEPLNSEIVNLFSPSYMQKYYWKYLVIVYTPSLFHIYKFIKKLLPRGD